MPALITNEYRDLNAQLHATAKYGSGSFRHEAMVMSLRDETGSETVLDYGCGKGTLGRSLGNPDWFSEYDPAVLGKDERPKKRVDMVVCTDVLEHIEPDLLDNVLAHIRGLTKKIAFIVIATRASSQTLADGRNAHLIQEGPDWWRRKIDEHFRVLTWHADADRSEIMCVVQAAHKVNNIIVKSAVSDDLRYKQAEINSAKTPRRLCVRPWHYGACIVAAYGPSLKWNWPYLKEEREATGAPVVSMSGSHDFLIDKGVIPDIHIDVDPREHKGWFTRNPHPDVKYWIASCMHPSVIDRLLPYDLTLWHIVNSENDFELLNLEPNEKTFLLAGGGSVGCRAVNLMYAQGYRRFSVYGMDCSFAPDGEQHAGAHSGKQQKQLMVKCGDRWFPSSGTLIAIARGFLQNLAALERAAEANGEPLIQEGDKWRIEMVLRGDGMLQYMARIAAATGHEPSLMAKADDLRAATYATPEEAVAAA